MIKEYKQKSHALKKLIPNENIMCNRDLKNYFILDNHAEFLKEIQKSEVPSYYEYISEKVPVNLFIDVDMKNDCENFTEHSVYIKELKDNLEEYIHEYMGNMGYNEISTKMIILEAHDENKKSYHVITRIINTGTGIPFVFKNVHDMKIFIKEFIQSPSPIDLSVYREGLFRTLYSTKSNENRPFKRNKYTDPFDDIESFITFIGNETFHEIEIVGEDMSNELIRQNVDTCLDTRLDQGELLKKDMSIIKHFVRKHYKYRSENIREIIISKDRTYFIVALNDLFCANVDREHKSNFQYIIISNSGSKQKCHDLECNNYKDNEVPIEKYSSELLELTSKHLVSDNNQQDLINSTSVECLEYIKDNFDENVTDLQFDKTRMIFKSDVSEHNTIVLQGKCKNCLGEHQISPDGYCVKCKICSSVFPKHSIIPVLTQKVNNFWQLVQHNQHNTIIINNNYVDNENFLNCDINVDKSIFRNKKLTSIINQILDGHKISKISMLLKLQNNNIVYDSDYFYFKDNIWKLDKHNLYLTSVILSLENIFTKVQNFYINQGTSEANTKLVKNIKCLINKLNTYKFKQEIVKESLREFYEQNFKFKLNSKQYLVPFKNGVWDLHKGLFRDAIREDYINLTLNYIFDPNVKNEKVYKFINSILPDKQVRDYVLKEFSKCLNGEIPNTKFLIFIGDGANGKSQLLNLMKITMGDFGEKMESTLLTRKRNNPNETSSEKLKLMNKRFAFLSEPEDGEKFNIGLLKELTGSEEIVARGLYIEPVSFIMQVKLYLACNELPEVKGEDTAIWRRLRVVDFPSKFVVDPKEPNEYKLDTSLPNEMREDITWRQTFLNILLEYYYLEVPEPQQVQIKTNQYRDENNKVFAWCEENIVYNENEICKYTDLCSIYFKEKATPDNKTKSKFRKTFEEYLKILSKKYPSIHCEAKSSSHKGHTYFGWKNIEIKQNEKTF